MQDVEAGGARGRLGERFENAFKHEMGGDTLQIKEVVFFLHLLRYYLKGFSMLRVIPFILFLILVCACHLTQWFGAEPKMEGPGASTLQVGERFSNCCWCYDDFAKENAVSTYVHKLICEDRNARNRNLNCRKVKVVGPHCSFKTVSLNTGEAQCAFHDLEFLDNGTRKKITHPAYPCDMGQLAAQFSPDMDQVEGEPQARGDGDNPSTHPKKYNRYWTCGRAPDDHKKCHAFLVENGEKVEWDTADMPPGEKNCNGKVCDRLFSAKYASLCPVYEAGTP